MLLWSRIVQENLNHLKVIADGGEVQRALVVLVQREDVRAVGHQNLALRRAVANLKNILSSRIAYTYDSRVVVYEHRGFIMNNSIYICVYILGTFVCIF